MPITPVEFLKPLKNQRLPTKALAAAFYLVEHQNADVVTTSDVMSLFKSVRDKNSASANVSQAFVGCANSGYLYNTGQKRGREILWAITDTGKAHIRELLGIVDEAGPLDAEIKELTLLANTLTNEDVRDYLKESIACLKVPALRAALVFLWAGAIWTVQEWLMAKPLNKVNDEIKRHQKTRDVKTIDDFAFVNDNVTLLVARDLGLWDKGQHTMVEHALDLRNQCGHPSRYKLLPSRCKSVIEELIILVFNHAA